MTGAKAELIFHPVRMRILQALLRSGRMTPGELGGALDDVPPATLYRHIKALTEGGAIEVVEERPVRGVVERLYAVDLGGGASLTSAEAAGISREEHVRYFAVFLAGLLGEFERYLSRPSADPARDGMGYRQFPLHLSDDELKDLLGAMDALLQRAMANEPGPARTPRLLTRILVPSSDPDPTDGHDERGE